tara:strand:- start:5606 stop:5941 length:336 start_codon:yes stop_codon:yes gene_type:complete
MINDVSDEILADILLHGTLTKDFFLEMAELFKQMPSPIDENDLEKLFKNLPDDDDNDEEAVEDNAFIVFLLLVRHDGDDLGEHALFTLDDGNTFQRASKYDEIVKRIANQL